MHRDVQPDSINSLGAILLRVRKDHQIQVQDNRFIHSGTSQHNNIFALENK